MRKSFKYRLYPTKVQQDILSCTLDRCRELYNAALQERRDAWKQCRVSVSFKQQSSELPGVKEECPEYNEVYSQVLQDVIHRVDKTFKAFYHRAALGQSGYPRFKGFDRYDSFAYPQSGFWLTENRLILSKIGSLKVKLHRPIAGQVKTLTLKREAGKWYAIFSCDTECVPLVPSSDVIGIDMGLESFLATSDGEFVDNPRFLRKAEASLVKSQQKVSGRKKGSRRRRKAAALLHRKHLKVADVRRDFHHKLARKLVNKYGTIVAEGLHIQNMVKNHCLAKSISDAGWGYFLSILAYKAEEAGRRVILVNPRNTSQICSRCGAVVPKDLSERWHHCSCGLSLHRDVNASCNILRLGLSLQASS